MEQYLERSATPARVRYAMRKHLKGYDIAKIEGTWRVVGSDAWEWFSNSLSTRTFKRGSVAYWIEQMIALRDTHRRNARIEAAYRNGGAA